MSQHPSLNAALKRLKNMNDLERPIDLDLVCDALRLVADCAEHTDSADGQPVFTVRLPCLWTAADKGFLHALSQCRGRSREDVG